MTFPGQIQQAVGTPATIRVGVVASTSPLTVNVQGALFTELGVIGWYVPVVGETVLLVGQSAQTGSQGASWAILGDVSPSGGSGDDWTPYTPVWTTTGGAPTLGAGTIVGRWQQVRGKTIAAKGVLTWGAGTAAPVGGLWLITLPFPATAISMSTDTGNSYTLDAGTANRVGMCNIASSLDVLFFTAAPNSDISQGTPQTFVATDFLRWSIVYERA